MINPKLKMLAVALLFYYCYSNPILATTIVPFDNYLEMAKASKKVVIAKMTNVKKESFNNNIHDVFEFEVVNSIKGNVVQRSIFNIKTLSFSTLDGLKYVVPDDLSFEVGHSYLLSLDDLDMDMKQPKLLNYAIFEQVKVNNHEYLVPAANSRNAILLPTVSGKTPEPMIDVDKEKFVSNLKASLFEGRIWDIKESKADRVVFLEQRAAPTGCLYLGVSSTITGLRWENLTSRPIKYWSTGTAEENSYVATAVTELSSNYIVNFTSGGTLAAPSCGMGDYDNIISFINNLPPSSGADIARKAVVIFDDPCNIVTDLTPSGGVLAIGGAYYGCTANHTFNGATWGSACYGTVTVNNGTGAFLNSSTNYTIVLEHELTHVLGMDHLDATFYPNNNMNPSCCNSINTKDIQCMGFAYVASSALPVELSSFGAKISGETTHLAWTSSSEINHDKYVLERSADGKTFESLGDFLAKGSPSQSADYQYADILPLKGTNYYRLRIVSTEGEVEFSKIVSVQFEASKMNVKIYPNPTDGIVNFYIISPTSNQFNFDVFDITGKQVISKVIPNGLNNNILSLPTENWAKGMYYMRLSDNTSVVTQKFMKL